MLLFYDVKLIKLLVAKTGNFTARVGVVNKKHIHMMMVTLNNSHIYLMAQFSYKLWR